MQATSHFHSMHSGSTGPDAHLSINAEGLRPTAAAPAGAVDSSVLLRGQKAVAISHNGSLYRLQATKLGKLILTK
jgi:hemin uptake protein HemP